MLMSAGGRWLVSPLIPGDWVDLAPADAEIALALCSEMLDSGEIQNFLRYAHTSRMRAAPLSFYPGWMLLECQMTLGSGATTLVNFIVGDDGVVLLDGRADGVHRINAHLALNLDRPDMARDYLIFFCSVVRSKASRFEILLSPEQLLFAVDADEALRAEAAAAIVPAGRGDVVKDGYWFDAVVRYSDDLYRSSFIVRSDGQVDMKEETMVLERLPLLPDIFEGPFRLPPEPAP